MRPWFTLLLLLSCSDRTHVSLLEPEESSAAGTGGTSTGTASTSLALGGTAGEGGTSGAATTARTVWYNLMLIKRTAVIDGITYTFTDEQISDIETTFTQSLPTLIQDLTAGVVGWETFVEISEEPITSLGYNNDMVEPANVPDWASFASPVGTWDMVYLMSPRPQQYPYASGELATDPLVGWGSVSARADGGAMSAEIPGWLFVWVAELANSFYGLHLGLDHVPDVTDPALYGYAYEQGGYLDYIAYYKDVINRAVLYQGEYWGLGEPAWALGTIRTWALTQ